MSIKNDGHYFCRAGGNRPDGLNEPVTIVYQIKSSITFPILPGKAVSIIRYRPQQDSVRLSILQDLTRYREK
ncbi:hypothetical protein D9J33_14105 [Escherichia coli]|nr:hypothetical protein [Escherichia coli]